MVHKLQIIDCNSVRLLEYKYSKVNSKITQTDQFDLRKENLRKAINTNFGKSLQETKVYFVVIRDMTQGKPLKSLIFTSNYLTTKLRLELLKTPYSIVF